MPCEDRISPLNKPTHIVDDYDNTGVTRCGIKIKDRKALPYIGADHVQAHVDGYGMPVCSKCATTTIRTSASPSATIPAPGGS